MAQGQMQFQQPPAAPGAFGAQPQYFAPQQQFMPQLPAPQYVQPAAMYQQMYQQPMPVMMPAPVYPPFQPMGGGFYQQPGMAQPSPYGAQPQAQMQSFGPQSPATAAETRAERDARFESERAERQEKHRRELEDAQEKQRRLTEDAQHKAELEAVAQAKATAPKPEEKPKPVTPPKKAKKEKQEEPEPEGWYGKWTKKHWILSKAAHLTVFAILAGVTQEILTGTGAWKGMGDTNSQGGSMRDDLQSALGKDFGGGISDGFEAVGDFMADVDPALASWMMIGLVTALFVMAKVASKTYDILTDVEPDPKPEPESDAPTPG